MNELAASAESIPLNEPRSKVLLVDSNDFLQSLLEALDSNSAPIAIDAERASGFRYGQKAYLIQLAFTDSGIFLLDPVATFNEEALTSVKAKINLTPWIIHAASQDLVCLAEFGLKPTSLFDTELASRLLGLPKVSLGTITEHYLNLKLAKEHSAVDWSTRPFPQSWLDYAALDVDVLHDLAEAVEKDLVEKVRLEIAQQEFDFLLEFQIKEPKLERWRGTTGVHEFKEQRDLTIVKHIWEAREELALEKDISPGRLIPDASIVAAVKAKPKTRSELSSLRNFTGRASRTYIDIWWDSYYKGLTTEKLVDLRAKQTGIPNHRNWPTKFPEANVRLQWSKKLLAQLSIDMNIPQENIISPESVRTLCFTPPELNMKSIEEALVLLKARAWQIAAVTNLLIEAFGKTELPEESSKASNSDSSDLPQ
jgi:ribonuclease D